MSLKARAAFCRNWFLGVNESSASIGLPGSEEPAAAASDAGGGGQVPWNGGMSDLKKKQEYKIIHTSGKFRKRGSLAVILSSLAIDDKLHGAQPSTVLVALANSLENIKKPKLLEYAVHTPGMHPMPPDCTGWGCCTYWWCRQGSGAASGGRGSGFGRTRPGGTGETGAGSARQIWGLASQSGSQSVRELKSRYL